MLKACVPSRISLVVCCTIVRASCLAAEGGDMQVPEKKLPIKGEVFTVEGERLS